MGQQQFFAGTISALSPDPAYYTPARGIKLDNLDIPVSTAKNNVTVQRGVTVFNADTTVQIDVVITAVDMAKSFVSIGGSQFGSANNFMPVAYLTTGNNLRLLRMGDSFTSCIAWEVIQIA